MSEKAQRGARSFVRGLLEKGRATDATQKESREREGGRDGGGEERRERERGSPRATPDGVNAAVISSALLLSLLSLRSLTLVWQIRERQIIRHFRSLVGLRRAQNTVL